jgi:ATP-binding cassette, subfamily F, member 2
VVNNIVLLKLTTYLFPLQTHRTLIKLMAGELIQTAGDIRPHGHLKLGRFTQHFVDVLDLEKTPLDFFEEKYPDDAHEEQRKYLGRFGVSGKMQLQKMAELSDGQKSRVVFAYLGRLRYVIISSLFFYRLHIYN